MNRGNIRQRIEKIISYLSSEYESRFFYRRSDPFYVLISTVLSQRNRDESTIKVAKRLFDVYDTPEKIANAPLKRLESLVRSSGFFRVKARRIKRIAQEIIDRHGGIVPSDRESLMKLEGVGTKTAGCVLVYAFRKPAIPVDTHVHRISNRLCIISAKTPEKSELELMRVVPKKHWIMLNELMVRFGQTKCHPIRPECSSCGLSRLCCYYRKNRGTGMVR